ncbi:hypothetical protein TNCV_2447701 [Trichonephila clavipes]|uniref:Uncharacterized protein n=1 Tax=Trichonephila clavipes TaxID=2585209 RepID=A0A8X6VM24_TRICX|nr:hypothetical protein TNCV_2447701 [Trichonephila clavipes]
MLSHDPDGESKENIYRYMSEEGSPVRQSLEQACKEGVDKSLPQEVTLSLLSKDGSSIAINSPLYQIQVSDLSAIL